MTAYAWTPGLSVGVDGIDAQHRELFARVNRVVEVVEGRAATAEIVRVLGFLSEYVDTHFADEEALMRGASYPGAAAHAAEHARFVRTFRRLRTEFARVGADAGLAEEMRRDLCAWLVDHVSGTDRALGAFLRARGGEAA